MNTTVRSNNILAVANRLQMLWSNTVARVAEMVKCHSLWDWANKLDIRPAMGTHTLVFKREHPVPSNFGAVVNPTLPKFRMFGRCIASFINSPPKTVLWRWSKVICSAIAFPKSIMVYTKPFTVRQGRTHVHGTIIGGFSGRTPNLTA